MLSLAAKGSATISAELSEAGDARPAMTKPFTVVGLEPRSGEAPFIDTGLESLRCGVAAAGVAMDGTVGDAV